MFLRFPYYARDVPSSSGFTVFGIPVRVDLSFLVVAVLLGLSSSRDPVLLILWVAIVFVSVLWHELGHAFLSRAFGATPRIELYAMGGLTSYPSLAAIGPGRDILISLAGPAFGLLLGGLVWAAAQAALIPLEQPVAQAIVLNLLWVNVGWGILNLVPMLPLDGGRVMEGLLNAATRGRGEAPALVISLLVAVAAAVAAYRTGLTWAALLAVFFGANNLMSLQRRRDATRHEDYGARLADAYRLLRERDLAGASATASRVLAKALDGAIRVRAAYLHMWTQLLQGQAGDAAETIEQNELDRRVEQLQEGDAYRALGGAGRAAELLQRAFDAKPSDATGALLARALIGAGRLDDAVGLVAGPRAGTVGAFTNAYVGQALFDAQRYDEAATVGGRLFELQPHPSTGLSLARICARAGRREEALTWISRAVDAGFSDLAGLESDEDLGALRGTARFEEIRQRLSPDGRASGAHADVLTGTFCFLHPDRVARLACARCRRPICRQCTARTGAGSVCPECAAELRAASKGHGQSRVSPAVLGILLVNVLVFTAQLLQPDLTDSFGAYAPLIAEGQWYRLLTPMLLHAGIAHIGFNSFALWIYGPNAERAFGTARFLAAYVISGFLGGAASYAFGECNALGVGASGAIFGVIGVLLAYLFKRRKSAVMGRSLQGIFFIIAINLFIGFTIPGIDNVAHMGGLGAGILLGAGFDRVEKTAGAALLQAAVAAAVVALGVGLVAWRTSTFGCPGLG